MSIVKEGLPFIFVPLVIAAAFLALRLTLPQLGTASGIVCVIFFVIALFCAFFFRDPHIEITKGEDNILSPCNGTVMEVIENNDEKIIRVFLSIFNVHLQRAPVSGTVRKVEHKDGEFLMANNPEAFMRNEQNIITIESGRGIFVVRQIAGFLARRCVAWVKEGDIITKGDKIGLIKFSSQVDLHLPVNVTINVKKGDKIAAGKSIVGSY